jgi:acetyl esterase
MSSAITDQEVLDFIEATEASYPPDAIALSIAEQRQFYDEMCAGFRSPRPKAIAVEQGAIKGPGGVIPIRRYWPGNAGSTRVVYFHGGGFVVGGLDSHDGVCAEISNTCGLEVVAVDYRLCPEHRHPAAYEDALAAVDYFSDRPILVVGDSAGGNLAAAVALARRKEICGQVLIYPGLGGEMLGLAAYTERVDAPLLTTGDIHAYRKLRANGRDPATDPTFNPLIAKDFTNAPPCFVSAAEHDPLRDDGAAFAVRLTAAGVASEVIIEPELPHGHLRARHRAARAKAAFQRITNAISRYAGAA